ncbi:MAG: response regulator [bacterium]
MASTKNIISVSIIEDNHFLRAGWLAALQAVADFVMLGAYSSCEEAVRSSELGDSDVVLMDIGLPGMSGIEGVAYLSQHFPKIATIICTVYDDDHNIFDALCAGAVGYLLKEIEAPELIKAIRDAAAGGSPMTPNIARKVIATFHKTPAKTTEQLTEGESEVLHLLAQGKSYATIAGEVHLSLDGVRTRIRRIYEKLHVHTRSEAVAKGLSQRLIQPLF